MGTQDLKRLLARLAEVDLTGEHDDHDNDNDDGGAALNLMDLGVPFLGNSAPSITSSFSGGGFINVAFVDCTFCPNTPTIFENCWLNGVTFKNCDFRSVHLENVVMIRNQFSSCTFDCCWKNRKISESYVFREGMFSDISVHEIVPREIVAQDVTREEAAKAASAAPPPPEEAHESGYGKPKAWHSVEDDYKSYNAVQAIASRKELYNIPLCVGEGISFDNTPRAGLFIKDGEGCRYTGVRFIDSNFKNTSFNNCHFINVCFEDCTFEDVSLTEVVIMNRTYTNAWFHGCDWTRRVLTKSATIRDETFRRGGINIQKFPDIMRRHAISQANKCAWPDATALTKLPPTRYQQKRVRRDFSIKTATEVTQERLGAGEIIVQRVIPGAVEEDRRDTAMGTTFVTMSFD